MYQNEIDLELVSLSSDTPACIIYLHGMWMRTQMQFMIGSKNF